MRATALMNSGEANQGSNPMDDINPDDIARIEVIKGAAATTLYGTEAAGGVIQIFTKRGSAGAPAWTLGVDQGINTLGHIGPDCDRKPDRSWLEQLQLHRGRWGTRCSRPTVLARPLARGSRPATHINTTSPSVVAPSA